MVNHLRRIPSRVLAAVSAMVKAIPNPCCRDLEFLVRRLTSHGIPSVLGFDEERFKGDVLAFVRSMNAGGFQYRYSPSVNVPTLYSSVYACLTLSLFGEIEALSEAQRNGWADHFDTFQSETDGLFRDATVMNRFYEDSDWWGARHLALHIMAAYAALGRVPRFPFRYLDPYKDVEAIGHWLDTQDWNAEFTYDDNIDNKIMNVACALQFERDFRNDALAGQAVEEIQAHLRARRNPKLGIWGTPRLDDPRSLSRSIQFAYHLLPIFAYDHQQLDTIESMIELTLRTQNALGGYGVAQNSSACEDIDSVDLLCRLCGPWALRSADVQSSLRRGLVWIFANQNEDGGFVFRRNEPFTYGHPLMSSRKNESAMFPTWFRSLSVVYATRFLGMGTYQATRCPGLQFLD